MTSEEKVADILDRFGNLTIKEAKIFHERTGITLEVLLQICQTVDRETDIANGNTLVTYSCTVNTNPGVVNRKIKAIKAAREYLKLSLKEAKEFVEGFDITDSPLLSASLEREFRSEMKECGYILQVIHPIKG